MYTFIVNPHSRSGKGREIWEKLEPILKERKTEYDVLFTKYQKHAVRLTRELTSDGEEHTLIVLGGDGTINEVLNGIAYFNKITLGYIPTGSSNDFARAHHLPSDPPEALNYILAEKAFKALDIGLLQYQDKNRHFMVSTGIGFDAAVCHQAAISKMKVLLNRLKLGKLTYVGIALNRLIFSQPCRMTVTLDGETPVKFNRAYFATAMNHCYEGGGFKFCPDARPDDQLLDVIVVNNASKLKLLLLLPFAFGGLHTRSKCVHIYTCRKVMIGTERALPVHSDGEPVFLQREITASLSNQQIRLIID